ncbi:hypothetical protein E2562_000671 [Oryza meyeriana var. granulata]|uniref:cysteine dioxygenase n=1 Tax=Oryza meyeriana var. granulata TaxID=110450 RepID=A0A6G1DV08_9ORYZ|nr:hypothetical protein E2562_000671 [Oryza meyeriana var. granulata]
MADGPPGRALVDLDGDVLANCTRFLGARDVASLAMACRPLRAAAYCDAVWYRLFRERWPFQQVPRGALGLRELYIHRHIEVYQMKFVDPISAVYYPNPTEVTPSCLMLDRNYIWLSQGPMARRLRVDCPEIKLVENYKSHGARITCMRLFPLIDTPLSRGDSQTNEKALVTSSADRTVRLCWKGHSRCFKGHSGPVTALSDKLLGDGEFKVLASGGEDCTVRLWSMSTRGKNHPLLSTFHGHEKTLSLLSVAWHKPSLLVSCSKDSKVKVWDTMAPPSSGSSSCVGSTHLSTNGAPIAVKCHESLCYIASGSEVTAIDLRTMKKASVLVLHDHRILSCDMLPSEWLICTGIKDKALLWDIRKSQELPNTVAELHSDDPVTFLHLDPYKQQQPQQSAPSHLGYKKSPNPPNYSDEEEEKRSGSSCRASEHTWLGRGHAPIPARLQAAAFRAVPAPPLMRVEAGGLPEQGTGARSGARDPGARRRRRQQQQRGRSRADAPPGMSAPPPAVQGLFEACREVFGASACAVPSPAGVERIKSVLDSISAADVSLTPNMSYFRRVNSHGTPKITYLHLYECEAFSIGIFCLPPRGVIPLHNHPNMTVFSKLLFGELYVKSYDWAEASQDSTDVQLQGLRLANVKVDGILNAPCETSVLYPEDGGNLHCFTAQTACAVLDVLGPPYDDGSGRHCQHYNVSSSAPSAGDPRPLSGGDGYAWLEECETPDNFHLVGSTYMGPRIVDI